MPSLFRRDFYLFLSDNSIIDYQYAGAVDQSVVENRVDFRETVVAKMCSNITSVCYGVYDRKVTQEKYSASVWVFTASGFLHSICSGQKEIVERHLLVEGFSDESDSVIRLISPEGESFDTSDTRIWSIDHYDIRSENVAGMLVAPFLLSSLSLDLQNIGRTVLEIGLGGGSFSMALHKIQPNVNITVVEIDPVVLSIAQEWFGVTNSRNHHIIIDDGLNFIKDSVTKSM
ncbi:hypothetical protein DICVIV_06554 [Dictyocaulus viviparus]|uniref:PABS domain-containing protein n=1 Tax=Dictyocaulus viviparus TaxID=29172 RepID=A0A0D8XUB8_DICVI|nr:hypothetical protein DICVIV_06554 [Dictyocaulus viviparus]